MDTLFILPTKSLKNTTHHITQRQNPVLSPKTRFHSKGFTLMELMIGIAIIAIVSAVTVPTLIPAMANYRLKAGVNDLVSNFQYAKMEAVKRKENIVLTFDKNTHTYQIFVDNGNGGGTAEDFTKHNDEPSLGTISMPAGVTIESVEFEKGASKYTEAGFNNIALPADDRAGDVIIKNSYRTYKITLSPAGNVSSTKL
ncbi:GspH/FimT family pseudopilin [Desulfobacterales bacterium HSG17]|nr:GspH/FimT family pseudopilin [Desulfobacterales bacterium HSG17]